ncbi:unnamed protein product [Urochloa humidicola]
MQGSHQPKVAESFCSQTEDRAAQWPTSTGLHRVPSLYVPTTCTHGSLAEQRASRRRAGVDPPGHGPCGPSSNPWINGLYRMSTGQQLAR